MSTAYWSLEDVPRDFGPCCATIGNFDGVHLGHQKIFTAMGKKAKKNGWRDIVVTFNPHPTTIVAPERVPTLLTGITQRVQLFGRYGVETSLVIPFTSAVASLVPEVFVQQILLKTLNAKSVVVGEGFRFGQDQTGDTEVLKMLGQRCGFEVKTVVAVVAGGSTISSSRIRNLVFRGQVEEARQLLGRPFDLYGQVVSGQGVGSKKTVPTLNISPEKSLIPADGVYITSSFDPDSKIRWESVTNIGFRPTFSGTERTIETFLLADSINYTPERLELSFYERLRDEKRFESANELREQILNDVVCAERFFSCMGEERGKTLIPKTG